MAKTRAEGFGPEVTRRILLGTYALSAGYYDAYYLKAQQLRHLISDDFKKAYEKVDVIMAPTTPETGATAVRTPLLAAAILLALGVLLLLAALGLPAAGIHQQMLADSLRYAAWAKTHRAGEEWNQ